jgi:hypothetical protein
MNMSGIEIPNPFPNAPKGRKFDRALPLHDTPFTTPEARYVF